jgi:DNA-binding transcriptional ArsR family regulator
MSQTAALMADLLDITRREIEARLGELRPLVQEAANLEAALVALDGVGNARTAPSRRRAASRRRVAPDGRRGRVSREQLIEHLRAHPGSTAGDVASALGLKRTSVSTRLAQLAKAGELTKAERGYAAP